jgi:hypothetical protein
VHCCASLFHLGWYDSAYTVPKRSSTAEIIAQASPETLVQVVIDAEVQSPRLAMRQLRLVANQERHAAVADTPDQRSFWLTGQGIAALGDQPWGWPPLSTGALRQLPQSPILTASLVLPAGSISAS